MRRVRLFTALLAYLAFTTVLHANCASDQNEHSTKTQLLITNLTISGTQTIDSAELATIANQLTGDCVDDDNNTSELKLRVKALFQDRGYMDAVVEHLHIKASDPLALPKPVSLEAEVIEGPRFTVAEIKANANRNVQNEYARLFKLREFHLRLFQKGDTRIGVLPQA